LGREFIRNSQQHYTKQAPKSNASQGCTQLEKRSGKERQGQSKPDRHCKAHRKSCPGVIAPRGRIASTGLPKKSSFIATVNANYQLKNYGHENTKTLRKHKEIEEI